MIELHSKLVLEHINTTRKVKIKLYQFKLNGRNTFEAMTLPYFIRGRRNPEQTIQTPHPDERQYCRATNSDNDHIRSEASSANEMFSESTVNE